MSQIYALLSVKFSDLKKCRCKKSDKYQVCPTAVYDDVPADAYAYSDAGVFVEAAAEASADADAADCIVANGPAYSDDYADIPVAVDTTADSAAAYAGTDDDIPADGCVPADAGADFHADAADALAPANDPAA